jgi:hypothetical protein
MNILMEYIALPDRYKKREDHRQMYLVQTSRNCDPYLANSGTIQELIDQSSGSGSGLPLLVSTDAYVMRSSRERSEHRYVGSGWFVYRVLTGSVPV